MWRSSGETQSLSDDDGFRHRGGVAGCQTDMIAELMAALFLPPLTQRLLIFLLSDVDFFVFFFFPFFSLIRGRIALGGQQKANALPGKCCRHRQAIAQIQCI